MAKIVIFDRSDGFEANMNKSFTQPTSKIADISYMQK
jgi:hypothetical protein